MKSDNVFIKFPSNQFVPITKTPWGGSQIAQIKKKYLSDTLKHIPDRIGESLEARWDSLLLKWIDATELLSVQVHPTNSNQHLTENECGKIEAWFVHSLHNPAPLYLGFKDGFSQTEIINCLKSQNPADCLHSFIPKKNDYISIPTGCVHALGPGILAAEPQIVQPNKEGKTFRLFDWNRLYDANGKRSTKGAPRELHIDAALSAIDWNLPRGTMIEKTLVQTLKHGERFKGNSYNPFCVQFFSRESSTVFESLIPNQFSMITVFSGKVIIEQGDHTLTLCGGETGLIKSTEDNIIINVSSMFTEEPCALIFSLKSIDF